MNNDNIKNTMDNLSQLLDYQKFIADHGFASVKNCFLMPTENSKVEHKGEVSLSILSGLELQDIKVRLIPAKMAYEHYLSGRKMVLSKLEL